MSVVTFFMGFVAGILVGIGYVVGLSPYPGAFVTSIAEQVCESTNEMNTSVNCSLFVSLVSVVAAIISVVSIIRAIRKSRNWKVGIIIYIAGFGAGVLLIFFLVLI